MDFVKNIAGMMKGQLLIVLMFLSACTYHGQITPTNNTEVLGNIGSFAISGVTGGSDVTNDWNLNTTNIATISWQAVSGASSYDVAIYNSVGTTQVCPLQNSTTNSFTFSGCSLTMGQTYSIGMWAKNSASSTGTAATNNFATFKVNQAPVIPTSTITMMYNGVQATGNPITAAGGSDPDGDTITITSVSSASKGTPALINSTTVGYTPSGTSYGADSFTVTYTDGLGATTTATVNVKLMTAHTWMGLVNSNWDAASNNFCGSVPSPGFSGVCAGGGRPTSASTVTHIAVFNSLCTTNCSPTITAAQTMYGLDVDSTYSGTITQGTTNTITVGPGGFYLRSGNFVGGSGNITVGTAGTACDNGNMAMSVTTSGSFTSTSGTLRINMGDFTMTPGTFSHNNGLVNMHSQFAGGSDQTLISANNHFYNFGLIGAQTGVGVNSNLYVDNDLTINRTGTTSNRGILYGNVYIGGNLSLTSCTDPALNIYTVGSVFTLTGTNSTVTGAFSGPDPLCSIGNLVSNLSGTLTLSGIVRVRGDFKINSGTVSAAGSTLVLAPSSMQLAVATIIPGASTYGNVQIYGNAANIDLSAGTMNIGGDLTLGDLSQTSSTMITNGTFNVAGNLNLTNEGYLWGNYNVVMNGVNQTITGVAGASVGNLTVNSSGTLTLSGQVELVRNFVMNTNTLSAAGSTLVFDQRWSLNPTPTVATGTGNYGNVIFPNNSQSVDFIFAGTNWNILGNLSILNVSGTCAFANSTVNLYGNLTVSGGAMYGAGGSSLKIIGAGRTITQGVSTEIPFRSIYIGDGATATSVTSTSMSLARTSQTLTLTNSGTLSMGGNSLAVTSGSGTDNILTLNIGSILNMGGGTLTYESLVNNGTLNP